MIVYNIKTLFGRRIRYIKERRSDKNKRFSYKRFRRLWFWHEDKWNQRHGITNDND